MSLQKQKEVIGWCQGESIYTRCKSMTCIQHLSMLCCVILVHDELYEQRFHCAWFFLLFYHSCFTQFIVHQILGVYKAKCRAVRVFYFYKKLRNLGLGVYRTLYHAWNGIMQVGEDRCSVCLFWYDVPLDVWTRKVIRCVCHIMECNDNT